MILYHFTDIDSLAPIQREGLHLGNPNTSRESVCMSGMTWLTTMDTPKGHGLTFGEPVTDWERTCFQSRRGQPMPACFTQWPDKSRVRIKVIIPSRDQRLVQWSRWRSRVQDPQMIDLSKCGDATRLSSRSWFIYFGVIEPGRFSELLVDGQPLAYQQAA